MTDDAAASVPERKRGAGAKIVYDLPRDEILNLKLAPGSPIDEVQPEDDRPAGHRRMMSPKRTGGGAGTPMCGGGLAVDAGPLFPMLR